MDGPLLSFRALPPEEREVEWLVRDSVLSAEKPVEPQAAVQAGEAPTLARHETPTLSSWNREGGG